MLCSHASPNTLKRGLGAIVFLGTFALMEAHIREPNRGEAVAIGTIRAVITGESSYAALYGYYDTLECLAGTRTGPECSLRSRSDSAWWASSAST